MGSKILSAQQVYAIGEEKVAAMELQEELGVAILADRRSLMTYGEIAEKNGLMDKSGLSEKCMSPLVHHILHGYEGRNSLGAIIEKKEARYIIGKIRERLYAGSLGKLSKEERIAASSKSGTVCYEMGVGIFGRNEEAIRKDSASGGRASAEARGQEPWEDGEKLLVHLLYKSGVYSRKEIAPFVNKLWGNNRSVSGIRCQETRFKKNPIKLDSL